MSFVAAPTYGQQYVGYQGYQYGAPQASLGSAYAAPMITQVQGYGQPAMGMASYPAAQPQYALAPQMSYTGGQPAPMGSYMPSQAMFQQQVMQPSLPMSQPMAMTTPAPNDMALQSAPSMIAYPGASSPLGMAATAPQENFSTAPPIATMPEPPMATVQQTAAGARVSSKKSKRVAGGKKKSKGGCC
mmetsp:Transcript_109178/g.216774  ORF Transcript_109178/g.216774 Transcript_109178/m.216774 type:complete len:187 (+) Transcript_109178:87-647(+)